MSNEKAIGVIKYLDQEGFKEGMTLNYQDVVNLVRDYDGGETTSLKEREKEFLNQMQIEYDIVKKHYFDGLYKDGVFEGLRLAKVIFNELLTKNQPNEHD